MYPNTCPTRALRMGTVGSTCPIAKLPHFRCVFPSHVSLGISTLPRTPRVPSSQPTCLRNQAPKPHHSSLHHCGVYPSAPDTPLPDTAPPNPAYPDANTCQRVWRPREARRPKQRGDCDDVRRGADGYREDLRPGTGAPGNPRSNCCGRREQRGEVAGSGRSAADIPRPAGHGSARGTRGHRRLDESVRVEQTGWGVYDQP